jgi:hypothetical protein
VTQGDLTKGVLFTRKDGTTGQITAKGKALQVEYVTNRKGWHDSRTTRLGIFETHFSSWLSDAVLVGSAPPVFDWSFSPSPPVPRPGVTWHTGIRQTETDVGYGTEMVELVSRRGSNIEATFTYLAEAEAKLSGCTYRILPVEATFKGRDSTFTRRWIYFPDLGFGLETRRDGVGNGLTALVAQ